MNRQGGMVMLGVSPTIQHIFKGDKVPISAFDIDVDQLKIEGKYLASDYAGTINNKVIVDAVIEGEQFHVKRTVRDIFENPMHG